MWTQRWQRLTPERRKMFESMACVFRSGSEKLIDTTIEELDVIDSSLDRFGNTALHFAVDRGDLHAVLQLLKNGAYPNHKNLLGDSVMDKAVRSRRPDIVALLRYHGGGDTNLLKPGLHELWRLRQFKLNCKGNVSYYDFIMSDDVDNAKLMRIKTVREGLRGDMIRFRRFPLYRAMLKDKVKKAFELLEAKNNIQDFLLQSGLPHLVIEHIVGFMDKDVIICLHKQLVDESSNSD